MTASSTSKVIRLELELTNTCNLKCPLCIRQTHPQFIEKGQLSAQDFIDIIETYPNLQYVTIAGPTSEPTLHPELFDIISYLITRDVEISLFINGDTHDDNYYRKLGLLFSKAKGQIYFTICGSTQELHEKYRVGSKLENVLRRADIVNKFSRKTILTWIVFNYNEEDFNKNKNRFEDKFELQCFYTLPVKEHYELESEIHLPKHLQKIYQEVNKEAEPDNCPAKNMGFRLIDSKGKEFLCSLQKQWGTEHCWECSKGNLDILRKNKIYNIAEAEDDVSEEGLRL